MSSRLKRGTLERIANPDPKQVNLEHVLPQNPSPVWHSDFRRGVDLDDFVYRLGNLTLLTAKVNKDAANSSFAEKKRLALDGSSLAINDCFRSLTKWTDEEIDNRQSEMAKTAVEVWKL